MAENTKEMRENRKPHPDYVGGKRNRIAESNRQGEQQIELQI